MCSFGFSKVPRERYDELAKSLSFYWEFESRRVCIESK